MAQWCLISGEGTRQRAQRIRAVVGGLRSRGLKVGGFFQESRYEGGARVGSSLFRVAVLEEAQIARTGVVTEECFCSMAFDEAVFARARSWLESDLAWADVVVVGDISKLEGGGRGHAAALERALRDRALVVISVRPDQLFSVVERFGLGEPLAVVGDLGGEEETELGRLVEAIARVRSVKALRAGELDWDRRWREMAGARKRERVQSDPWEKRAKRFARMAHDGRHEWLFDVLGPLLRRDDRVLEIGAGTGRHLPELARRTQWVHAFEPSPAMRAELEKAVAEARLSNVQVSPEAWPPATAVVRADVAFSCHVLYAVEDAAAFLCAMTASARRLCALVLAPRPPMSALAALELAIRGEARPRAPGALEAFALLWQLGWPANLQLLPGSGRALRFRSDGDDLLELCHRLGFGDDPEDQARVRAALIETAPEVQAGIYEVGTQGPHALITWPGAAGD